MKGFIETVESGGKIRYIRAEAIQAFNNGGIFFQGNYLLVNDTAAEIAAKILAAEVCDIELSLHCENENVCEQMAKNHKGTEEETI